MLVSIPRQKNLFGTGEVRCHMYTALYRDGARIINGLGGNSVEFFMHLFV